MALTQDFHAALPRTPHRLGRDTASFLLSLIFVLLGAAFGYGIALLSFRDTVSLILTPADAYAGCQLPAEYAVRAAALTRPLLLETALMWISAYVSFEKPLLALLFGQRGFSIGAAVCTLASGTNTPLSALIPFAYTIITAIFLILTRCIRKEERTAPLSETAVYALIAGGIACAVLLLISSLY